MEDDNGLELSLGLSCGGSAGKSKSKSGSPSDTKAEEVDRGNKIGDDFKTFLHGSAQKQDSGAGSQRSDSVKPQENFFNDLSKVSGEADASTSLNNRGLWVTNSSRSAEIEEEKQADAGNKRKMLFDEINNKKRLEREAHSDLHDKTKMSHVSITTTEGSTAENEDVAESEVEGSTSRLVSHHDDGSKRYITVGGSSDIPKEVRGFSDSSVVDTHGQKRFNGSSENEFKVANISYGVPFSVQPMNIMNIPYTISVRDPNPAGVPGTSVVGMTQKMPTASVERSGAQPVNPGNTPVMFGYSPVQLPMFDKDNSWGLVSQSQQIHPSYAGRGPPNSDKHSDGIKIPQAAMQVNARNSSEAVQFDGRTIEWAKGEGKQHAAEEGSSARAEDVKVSGMNHRTKDASDRSTPEGISLDLSAIKPGIAAEVKFGGCGSYPNLPWVSTTGSGPNGRTISGVTYRYSSNQIRIVCACHGSHMSPEEFVRHASDENVNAESGTGVVTIPSSNPAASAQS